MQKSGKQKVIVTRKSHNIVLKELNRKEKIFTDKYIDLAGEYSCKTIGLVDKVCYSLYTKTCDAIRDSNLTATSDILDERINVEVDLFQELAVFEKEKCNKLGAFIKSFFAMPEFQVLRKCNKNVYLARKCLIIQKVEAINNYTLQDVRDMVEQYVETIKNIQIPTEESEETHSVESDNSYSYTKVYDPREMGKLAEENGYERVRTSGDHIIYKHIDSNKIVVIPAHILGKGLMLTIQKQIQNNKECGTSACEEKKEPIEQDNQDDRIPPSLRNYKEQIISRCTN